MAKVVKRAEMRRRAEARKKAEAAGRTRWWVWGGVGLVGVIVVVAAVLTWEPATGPSGLELEDTRLIVVGAIIYQRTYTNGYPASLAELRLPAAGTEPDCNAAGVIDPELAGGRKYGYVFDYQPGPLIGESPPGCPIGVESFTLSVRPEAYGRTGTRSLFTDQTGVIHWTEENRAATADDPPL